MPFQALYKNTFGENADLDKVAEEHPYFSAAHFFRLQKTGSDAAGYNTVAAKAALHFANPYLLNQQLTLKETKVADNLFAVPAPEKEATPIIVEEPVVVEEHVTVEEPVTAIAETATSEPAEEQQTEEVVAEKETTNTTPLFEPLHTTDYFASQGIKLSENILTGDKMGKQLKSFTDWLKTMKKVHPDGTRERAGVDGFIDPSVQKLAEKSNKEEEVLTESMAEVYLQQGKTNKAKEIYEKLSLLNPSKNAYFAAKLNEIQ